MKGIPAWLRQGIVYLVIVCATLEAGQRIGTAQTTTGSIYGALQDASGAVIPGATVVATNLATGETTAVQTNNSGEYVFPSLKPGTFGVKATASGFQSVTQTDVTVSSNQNVHVAFQLKPGQVGQEVTVEAGTTMVDTRESQLATTIGEVALNELPLNGRNAYDLVPLVPGVTNYTADSVTGSRLGASFSVNGLPLGTASFYLDGTPDTAFYMNGGEILPNPSALQEFRLLTANYDSEFGRAPGGVLNVISKGGDKIYHGVAYEYLRNNIFNAKNYFATSVTSLKQHQFGAAVGGPVPRFRHAFFFTSYEGLRVHTPAQVFSGNIITASALEVQGDFSQTPNYAGILLPTGTNCGVTGGPPKICPQSLDPVAQYLLKTFVPVTVNGITPQQSAEANIESDQGLGRIDFGLGAKHRVQAMFFRSQGMQDSPNAGPNKILDYSGMNNYDRQMNGVIVDDWTISSRTVNNLRPFYSYNRYIISSLHPEESLASVGSTAPEGGYIYAAPNFTINGYFTMGTNQNGPSDLSQTAYGLVDTANLTRGHHDIKVGGSFTWNVFQANNGQQSNGIFTFTGGSTSNGTTKYPGNALADFLLGRASSLVQSSIVISHVHQANPALYFQDDWQITRRLNLNLGARWEVFPPLSGDPTEGTFSAGQQSTRFPTAPLGLVFEGDTNVPNGVYHTSWKRVAPRVGFAYDVFGDGRTGLRGGFGVFYNLNSETASGNLTQQPYGLTATVNGVKSLVTPFAPGVSPFPYVVNTTSPKFVGPSPMNAAPLNGATPYVLEYNMTVEQQLSTRWALHIAYVGNQVRKFSIAHDINAPTYLSTCTAATCTSSAAQIALRRPFEPTAGAFGQINLDDFALNQNYNSLQASLQGRLSKAMTTMFSYTWSKALSYENPSVYGRDLSLNYGPATTDIRNNFAGYLMYRLPNFALKSPALRQAVNGWQINGIVYVHSGTPFTLTSGYDTNFDNQYTDRADVVLQNPYGANTSRKAKIYGYLNPAAFAKPTGPYGDEQRNSLTGPGYALVNASVLKDFPVHDRLTLELRAEGFNVLNYVNLATPTLASMITLQNLQPNQTQINSTVGQPRVLQFAAKAIF